ncbi:MAG TPA: SSI family serine proteinase inhibitor [Gaiellaceae bacterium]|jgi:hypothetical protein|nr:SSI family serine proteinase inhibitor [Gaiellaceae bacterium]
MHVLGLVLAMWAFAPGVVAPSTSLTITARAGDGSPPKTWTLRCAPARGTLPKPGRACVQLARARAPFAPVPRGVMCSQIYGGPQTAHVVGVFRGQRVNAGFSRRDGCQTARWNRVAFLFPIFTGTLPPPQR